MTFFYCGFYECFADPLASSTGMYYDVFDPSTNACRNTKMN